MNKVKYIVMGFSLWVSGCVVDWMASYLSNRVQYVDINGNSSDKIKLEYGFPQGSKIGPFGFKLYTKPLAAIAQKHGVYLHLYADDTQLYLPFRPTKFKIRYATDGSMYRGDKVMDG